MAQRKYLTLDGIRGLAAATVVFWHASIIGMPSPSGAYLAVDLFFLMSGFVIALSYENKIRRGLGFASFMIIRLKRLYPLYILGTALYLVYYALEPVFDPTKYDGPPSLLTTGLAATFFVPLKTTFGSGFLFPLSPVAWSLFFELLINGVFVLLLPILSNRVLIVLTAVCAALLVACGVHFGTFDIGWDWSTFAGGFARVGFSFFAGVLLYRYRDALPKVVLPTPLILLAVLVMMFAPAKGPVALVLTGLVLLVGFPVLCGLAVQTEPQRRFAALFAFSGAISYAIYALHHPLLRWGNGAAKAVHLAPLEHRWAALLVMLGVFVGCWLAFKFFDEPLRAWLARGAASKAAKPDPAL